MRYNIVLRVSRPSAEMTMFSALMQKVRPARIVLSVCQGTDVPLALKRLAMFKDIGVEMAYEWSYSSSGSAANAIERAVQDCEDVVFMDDDMAYSPDYAERLLSTGTEWPVVGRAVHVMREERRGITVSCRPADSKVFRLGLSLVPVTFLDPVLIARLRKFPMGSPQEAIRQRMLEKGRDTVMEVPSALAWNLDAEMYDPSSGIWGKIHAGVAAAALVRLAEGCPECAKKVETVLQQAERAVQKDF